MGSQLCCEACDHPALRAPLLKEGNWAVAGTLRGGSRENVGEGMGMGAIRSGLGKSDFLDNNDLPTNSSVPNNRLPWKNRATRTRTIHILYRAARNPLLQEGAGGGPERDCRTVSQSPAKRRPAQGGPERDRRVRRRFPANPKEARTPPSLKSP